MLVEIYMKKFSDEGFDVVNADNGSKAENMIKKERPDLVLLDLVLPEEDGFDVLKKIKAREETKDLQIIVFSNLSQDEDKQKAKRLGADGFITKSDFTPKEIVQEVKKILGTKEDASAEPKEKEEKKETPKKKEKAAPPKEETPETTEEEADGEIGETGKKILIMEDEDVFAEVFGKKLSEEGYRVKIVKNGAWGVKQAQKEKFDLFVIDILMPDIDGIEVVKMIKGDEKLKKIPMIISSNSVDEDEKKSELESLGVDEFLVKSRITPTELAKVVGKLIK